MPMMGKRLIVSQGDRISKSDNRQQSGFADFFQDFRGMLTELRGAMLGRGAPAVEGDRHAYAWNLAGFGSRVRPLDLQAARHDLRVGKNLRQVIDRACGYPRRLEFRQQILTRQTHRQRR